MVKTPIRPAAIGAPAEYHAVVPLLRYPILTWCDARGQFAGVAVDFYHDGGRASAVGATVDDVKRQLKEFLIWAHKNDPWIDPPDFEEPQLLIIRVNVRPEYRQGDRVFPCTEPMPLHVPCVLGRRSGDVLACALPTIGAEFDYAEKKELKPLVTQYVQQYLKGLTPQELSRYQPPRKLELLDLMVRAESRTWVEEEGPSLEHLEKVATPLGTRSMRQMMGRAWQRDAEVADLQRRVQQDRANVILVGEPGSGKTTVLLEAISRMARDAKQSDDSKPGAFLPSSNGSTKRVNRFWLTAAARIIAGMQYLGEWEERCEAVINELSTIDGVLCIENLLELLRVGGAGAGDSVAAFLLPYLQRGELRMVGEATPQELDAARRLLPGFAEVFQVLQLEPMSRQQAVAVLDRVSAAFKQNRKVRTDAAAHETIYRLFNRFMPYHAFPGKPVAFLKDLLDRAARQGQPAVGSDQIIERFTFVTGLPELFLRDDVTLSREDVLGELRSRVIGQDKPCDVLTDVTVTFKAALNDPQRPIGVLLFCGPTGVGKTELAKVIAEFFFPDRPDKDRMIRLDMSEFAGPGSARRLLGDPYGEPSDLIKRMRRQPFVVLLLDEIEKADSEVFDVLLNVLDEGRLTDHFGRVTNFRSAIIIMTSNLGGDVTEPFGFSRSAATDGDAEVARFFRPEFYNRIDGVVAFNPLGPDTIRRITQLHLKKIAEREGFAAANITLQWTDELVERLAERGFDRRYGARPLQRTVETMVVTPVARYLVEHPGTRDATLQLRLEGEEVRVEAES